MVKLLFIFALCLCTGVVVAQTTNTAAAGLNQNEVNVSQDGDYQPAAGGVIKTLPDGKKGKVVTIVPDTGSGQSPETTLSPANNNTVVNMGVKKQQPARRVKSKKPAGKTKPQ